MAFFALVAQLGAEGIVLTADPVTVVTAVWRSLDFTLAVASIALRGQVPALKGESPGLVKRPGSIPETDRRVAIAALRAQSSAMRVFMA